MPRRLVGCVSGLADSHAVAGGPRRRSDVGGGGFYTGRGTSARPPRWLGRGPTATEVPVSLFAVLEAAVSTDPTLEPEAATGRVWDEAVVGAGPAGSMAARELARRGATVLLVDRARFPRYKVCGGCLNPRSLQLLKKSGLGDLMGRLGAVPLTNLRLATRGTFPDIALPTGAGVSRESLDAALAGAAISAGAECLSGTSARLLPLHRPIVRRILPLRYG